MTAAAANASADALRPTPPPGMGRGAMLSVLAHALLVVALAVGLSWRSRTPQTFSAELWSAVPQAAAPRGEPAPPPAPPPPRPAPAPAPRPAPPVPAPAPPKADAQIAIEKAREAQRQREQQAQAERARIERERAEKAKAEREKAERDKAEREKAEREKAERERAEKARAERERAEREKQAQAREEEARLARQREENLKRMMGQAGVAGATGAPTATGSAQRDAAPSASYAGRLIARVKPNIVLTAPLPGKPEAEVEVRAAPTGTILSRRLVRSSGNQEWDDAVLRAIDRTGELPRDVDGRVPPVVLITFTP